MTAGPDHASLPSGLLLVDKPAKQAVSSMTVCRVVKRALMAAGGGGVPRSIKVGHAGTLDPLASGLMIVLVGRAATRMCDSLMAGEKTYETVIDLAHSSITDDMEGEQVANPTPSPLPTRGDVARVLAKFTGTIMQRPPGFSAMWVKGERAYDLARAGAPPVLEERPIVIHAIDLVEFTWPMLTISVRCGKGTYIRSLARDIGIALTGGAGCLAALRRTTVGAYSVENATPLESLPQTMTQADLIPVPPAVGQPKKKTAADSADEED